MTRVKIINAAEQHHVPVSNCSVSADIPVDGQFHDIHDDLLSVLADSGVDFEVDGDGDEPVADEQPESSEPETTEDEQPEPDPVVNDEIENAEATSGDAAAGEAAGLGGSAASPSTDADGDGHDDKTGQFVEGNHESPPAPRKRKSRAKKSA